MVTLNNKHKPTSTREVAIALEKQGFEVATYDKQSQMVAFYGNEETGHQAMKRIKEMKLQPCQLKRVWDYLFKSDIDSAKDGIPAPHWELTFSFEPFVPELTTLEEIKEALSQRCNTCLLYTSPSPRDS